MVIFHSYVSLPEGSFYWQSMLWHVTIFCEMSTSLIDIILLYMIGPDLQTTNSTKTLYSVKCIQHLVDRVINFFHNVREHVPVWFIVIWSATWRFPRCHRATSSSHPYLFIIGFSMFSIIYICISTVHLCRGIPHILIHLAQTLRELGGVGSIFMVGEGWWGTLHIMIQNKCM